MFDPYHKWLGISPKEQPPNHYRLLGVDQFEKDLDVIEGAADKQMGFVRQYQSGEHAAEAARVLNELALARLCLLKPDKKAEYDAKLRKKIEVPAKPDPEAAFADMPLPEIPSSAIVDLPARKRKSKKSKSLSVPPNVIWIAVAVVAAFFAFQFVPRGLSIPSMSEMAPTPDVPATSPDAPPKQAAAQTEVSAPAVPNAPIAKPSSPSPNIANSQPETPTQAATVEPKKPKESPTDTPVAARPPKKPIAVLDARESASVENELVGGTGGIPARIDLHGETMIGVDWQPGEWLGTYAISKVFPVAAGDPLNGGCSRVTAPKGYAVGAIKVVAPKYVSSLQLVYMKINEDGSLDPSETKVSKWLGLKPKAKVEAEAPTLSGEGKRLVGLHYRKAVVVDAIGILVEP